MADGNLTWISASSTGQFFGNGVRLADGLALAEAEGTDELLAVGWETEVLGLALGALVAAGARGPASATWESAKPPPSRPRPITTARAGRAPTELCM
ncbi:hypothetical protein GCM10009599_06640 [Luteococcus peritonei]